MSRVVNRFWKQYNNFLYHVSIAFKNDGFVFGKKRTSLKTAHLFWTLRKRKNYCFENDLFKKKPFVTVFYTIENFGKNIYWQFF